MKRTLHASVTAAFTLFLVTGCDRAGEILLEGEHYLQSGSVGWAMKKELRDKRSQTVDIARLTEFPWDELFLFGPYEPRTAVCHRLAIAPDRCTAVVPYESKDDSEMLMVFRHRGEVVHTEIHLRMNGDFLPVPALAVQAGSAVFDVTRIAGANDILRLRPLPQDRSAAAGQ